MPQSNGLRHFLRILQRFGLVAIPALVGLDDFIAYGHMGREDLGVRWENTGRVAALKAL